MKKIKTLEQLATFCEKKKLFNFNSKESNYEIAVQVPAELKFEEDSTQGLMFCKVKVCHTLLNRNHSYISEENMKKAMPTLKYRPLLGYIHQLDDGTYDFHAHDIDFVENEDGEYEEVYIESQIGTFTTEEPYLEYDKEQDKTYVIAQVAIPEEYTKACDIIREKEGTKVSCELVIDSFSYNHKEKYLEIEDFYFSGCTCLGSEKDGTPIGEGMLGSRLDIEDFSVQKNSMFSNVDANTRLIDTLEKLNTTLLSFNINKNSKEGGKGVNKLEELLEKYSKTKEDLTFEVESLTDEELEAKFAEAFDEADSGSDDTTDGTPSDEGAGTEGDEGTTVVVENEDPEGEGQGTGEENPDDQKDQEDDDPDDTTTTSDDDEDTKKKKYTIEINGVSRTFEVSLNDKIYALQDLVNATYGESDNTYYGITAYDDYVVMMDYWYGKAYKQSYKQDGDNFSLTGDRVEVFANWLTAEEEDALAEMRSNYSFIQEKLSAYEKAEMNIEKDKIFESEDYKEYLDKEEFRSLIENKEKYSVEELKDKAEIAFARCVREFGLYDNAKNNLNATSRKQFSGTNDKSNEPNPYGDLFND